MMCMHGQSMVVFNILILIKRYNYRQHRGMTQSCLMPLVKSFIYIWKRRGPKIDPSETPQLRPHDLPNHNDQKLPQVQVSQDGQTHSNNSSATADELFDCV